MSGGNIRNLTISAKEKWEKERDNIQEMLNKGLTHLEIGNFYNVTRGTIDNVVKQLGIVRDFEKFKIPEKTITEFKENIPNPLPMPMKYSHLTFFKIVVLRYRVDRGKYSTIPIWYIPEKGKWYVWNEFLKALKSLGYTYDQWECKWVLRMNLNLLYTSEWIDRVVLLRFNDKPEKTREIIKRKLEETPEGYNNEVFLSKYDFIEDYYKSREGKDFIIEYDFSELPEYIKSPREKVKIKFTYNNEEITYITNYYNLVIDKKDHILLRGSKIGSIKSIGNKEFIRRVELVYGKGVFDFSKLDYKNMKTNVTLIDIKTENEIIVDPWKVFIGKAFVEGKESLGETHVRMFLENDLKLVEGSGFESQKAIIGEIEGRNSNKVVIDFVLTYNKRTYWIEYNGEQHYIETEFFLERSKGSYSLEIQKKRDQNVRDYCKTHDIVLIEIPYTLENIDDVSEFLTKTIIEGVDPKTLIDYDKLYKK